MGMVAAAVVGVSVTLRAQSPPPVRGTIALEGTIKKVYRAANSIVVGTIDGVERVYGFSKNLVVRGGRGTGVDPLAGLREGSIVVMRYAPDEAQPSTNQVDRLGNEGLKTIEGIVTRIDGKRTEITVRFDSGTTETLRLTARAAAEAGTDIDQSAAAKNEVIVYYTDEGGRRVACFFKRVS
jgi:hypothetical protein